MNLIKKIILSILSFLFIVIISFLVYVYFPSKPALVQHQYQNWNSGNVRHLLPSFDHEKILVKVSLHSPVNTLLLKINNDEIIGKQNDPAGRFWQFYKEGLEPNSSYKLQILGKNKNPITDPWNIRTFPLPDSLPEKLTILTYTCAGGVEENLFGNEIFLEMRARRELLKKGLTFNPDIVIANGDHLYWDQRSFQISFLKKILAKRGDRKFGKLDLDQPMLSKKNYQTFTQIADAQIPDLYGCHLREQSVYFLPDDHDLFENDEALPDLVTLPPKDYQLDGARSTQLLYYPEFLSASNRSLDLPDYIDNEKKFSTSFGSINYGNLAEINLFDCVRFCDLKGDDAHLVPPKAEEWLIERTDSTKAKWHIQVPSTPMSYTAGKWSEWYPDILSKEGILTTDIGKYLWQKGWWNQHQRLLSAWSKAPRKPIIFQGDLHMASFGTIEKSGNLDLANNPIQVIGTAPLGTGKMGYPSAVRLVGATIPTGLEVKELMKPVEKNGFSIIEITPEEMVINIYLWRKPEKIEDIKNLKPTFTTTIKIQS